MTDGHMLVVWQSLAPLSQMPEDQNVIKLYGPQMFLPNAGRE